MYYVLSTSWHAHTKLHRGECARELLLEVAHDGRADELVEDGPYEPYYVTIFLGYGNQPSTKEVWSEVHWDELWWLAAILFLHSLQMALTASEFICLMLSALNSSASAALFSFAFFDRPPEVCSGEELCAWDEESPCMLSNESGIIGRSSCGCL